MRWHRLDWWWIFIVTALIAACILGELSGGGK